MAGCTFFAAFCQVTNGLGNVSQNYPNKGENDRGICIFTVCFIVQGFSGQRFATKC